ncbi:site-specific DNA-methyltransferase [Azospirillum sp. A26]|uniref:DNA-methyltransferase n=1 Tax=Azospirillum sp. A26 TaxID=3160607 RepID=UPI003670E835
MTDIQRDSVWLMLGDCLERMHEIPDGSVDMVLADLPYQATANEWDRMIPFAPLWEQYLRVAKQTAAIVLTASQPFSSMLVMSRHALFRHEWVWLKNMGSNFCNTVREPMKEHEVALVFSRGGWTYNKQMQPRSPRGLERITTPDNPLTKSDNTRAFTGQRAPRGVLRVPSSYQRFNVQRGQHPTQKPVDLMEYMIRTYSNPGETVLDNTMGSGTTGCAAVNTGRRFIGIEKDPGYFDTATRRVGEAIAAKPAQLDLIAAE